MISGCAQAPRKERTMMCKFFCVIFLCVFLLTGCGVPDQALVLTGENLSEEDVLNQDGQNTAEMTVTSGKLPEQRILVYVCGAVVNPGVVELPADSRVADALEAAGGLREEAQPDYVNLAAKLVDEQKLYFPTREETKELMQEEAFAASGLVDINTADADTLCTLPGIGAARAQDIIAYREENGAFEREEDIMKVPGIKEAAYLKLKDKITVR